MTQVKSPADLILDMVLKYQRFEAASTENNVMPQVWERARDDLELAKKAVNAVFASRVSPPSGAKHYCCYGMYADVGHSSTCPNYSGTNYGA